MGKKLIDVEDLLVWAASELARKRPGKVVAFPVFNVSRGDREIVGKWTRPMGYPPISPMFAAGLGQAGAPRGDPPHDDALTIEAAIARLRLISPPCECGEADLTADMGFAVDAEGALRAALANAANLALVHGRLGNRPALGGESMQARPKLGPNGKPGVWRREAWAEPTFDDHTQAVREVEVACQPKRKDLYPTGAYGRIEWEPDPQTIVNERAEYAAWRAGLEWLAEALSGELETRAALPPRAAHRPWLGEYDGDAVRDLYGPGADRVFSGDEAATLTAERRAARRRPLAGGNVYGRRPAKPAKGAREA